VRYPIKDQIAISGVGTTSYSRDNRQSLGGMVLEACVNAVRDAGLTAADIDGICGSHRVPPAGYVQSGLGIPACTWWCNAAVPFQQQIMDAMQAVYSGACNTVLAYHGMYRAAGASRSAAQDPIRQRFGAGFNVLSPTPDTFASPVGYGPWAGEYLRRFGVGREVLGKVAINSRSNAVINEHAAQRTPLTMEDYLSARMIREPLSVLDMDYPVDGADAVVITTAERARDLPKTPVVIHAAIMGQTGTPLESELPDLGSTGQQIVARELWGRSDITLADVDAFFPYDGFTIISTRWFEALGYCGDGEANDFFDDNWDLPSNSLRINGRVPVNSHGGSLSEGGTQGPGFFREAIQQLRGEAGSRQAPGARCALLGIGGFFFNSGATILRVE
jgi:acetyl-CoA acetyltransferase